MIAEELVQLAIYAVIFMLIGAGLTLLFQWIF
jgi:hypothetical protein